MYYVLQLFIIQELCGWGDCVLCSTTVYNLGSMLVGRLCPMFYSCLLSRKYVVAEIVSNVLQLFIIQKVCWRGDCVLCATAVYYPGSMLTGRLSYVLQLFIIQEVCWWGDCVLCSTAVYYPGSMLVGRLCPMFPSCLLSRKYVGGEIVSYVPQLLRFLTNCGDFTAQGSILETVLR